MEIWDGYLIDGTLANRDLIRGEAIPKGLYHLVCEILVRHIDGDYLLMQRDPRKPNYGGYYEATAGGSALKGESKLPCAVRELREETGALCEEAQPLIMIQPSPAYFPRYHLLQLPVYHRLGQVRDHASGGRNNIVQMDLRKRIHGFCEFKSNDRFAAGTLS